MVVENFAKNGPPALSNLGDEPIEVIFRVVGTNAEFVLPGVHAGERGPFVPASTTALLRVGQEIIRLSPVENISNVRNVDADADDGGADEQGRVWGVRKPIPCLLERSLWNVAVE